MTNWQPTMKFMDLNQKFLVAKGAEPNLTYAEYRSRLVVRNIRQGKQMRRLGPIMASGGSWEDPGRPVFEEVVKNFGILPHHRFIDYGCGTFQVGVHFIRYLNPGNYFGLEVESGIADVGRQMLGEELIKERKVRTGVIRADFEAAVAFGADIIHSCWVCRHVHPDEREDYFDRLSRLTHRPRARLIFDAVVGEDTVGHRATVLPASMYVKALPKLRLRKMHQRGYTKDGNAFVEFEFVRPDKPGSILSCALDLLRV